MTPVALIADPGRAAPRRGADPEIFADELSRQVAAALAALPAPAAREPAELLAAAQRERIEVSEVAAVWMAGEFDLDLKLAFARLCGDGARHFRLAAERIAAGGGEAARLDPLARGHSPLFRWLKSLETTCERVAAGAFARAGLARARDAALAALAAARGDEETARVLEAIAAEEGEQHQLGRRLLVRFAVTPEDQERARRSVARALQLSGERREPARAKVEAKSAGR